MTAILGLIVIGLAGLFNYLGVTQLNKFKPPVYRDQDPESFRKAIRNQVVIGLLFIVGWFVNRHWHIIP